jgi:hypothetical protein
MNALIKLIENLELRDNKARDGRLRVVNLFKQET